MNSRSERAEKILIFSQYHKTLSRIKLFFKDRCIEQIDGSVKPADRIKIIDQFNNSPAGTILPAQIEAGGTGLNIQTASVVVICEPQFKPSTENQAISRAYRMGQARNVMVYRILAKNSIDEVVYERLMAKQKEFDEYADRSTAAETSEDEKYYASRNDIQINEKEVANLLQQERRRIELKRANLQESINTSKDSHKPSSNKRQSEDVMRNYYGYGLGQSVTGRIDEVAQPYGGYIKPSLFTVEQLVDDQVLGTENIHSSLIGMAVDYLTRFMLFRKADEAFKISLLGASRADMAGMKNALNSAHKMIKAIKGLDDESIRYACKLVTFDVWFRNTAAAVSSKTTYINCEPDAATINNIRIMVKSALNVFEKYGPVIATDFTFEPSGYTSVVSSGDGDYLTADTMWDLKVLKGAITNKHTLQIMMYYIMGKHSGKSIFKGIKRIGFINPRLNKVYLLDVSDIDKEIIKEIEQDIICYEQ